jgi:hypothetical protein
MKNLKTELTATTGLLQQAREELVVQEQQHRETSISLKQQLVQEKERGSQALAELHERYGRREGDMVYVEVIEQTYTVHNTL